MAQRVQVFVTKPDGLSLVPRTHVVERVKADSYKLSSDVTRRAALILLLRHACKPGVLLIMGRHGQKD